MRIGGFEFWSQGVLRLVFGLFSRFSYRVEIREVVGKEGLKWDSYVKNVGSTSFTLFGFGG